MICHLIYEGGQGAMADCRNKLLLEYRNKQNLLARRDLPKVN